MDWRAEAIEKLRGYAAQKHRLEKAAPATPGEEEPDGLEAAEQEQARLWVSVVDRAMGILDPDAQLVLEALYIHPARRNVARLQEVLRLGQSNIYRRRNDALRVFTMALYGVDIAKAAP